MIDKKSSDFLWKIVLTGDSYVGKTTIRKRAMGEHFAEEYISTVGADFSSYKLKLGDLSIGFQVWDLAGQDKYKYIRSSFYGGATGCYLAFDVTNPKSLNSLSSWVDEAIRYSNGTIEIFIICANKIDLKGQREISRETGEQFTQALRESSGLQCGYIETSALTGENVDIAFDLMAKCLLEREGITPVKYKEEPISLPEESTSEQTMEKPVKKEGLSIKEEVLKPEIKTPIITKKSVLIADEDTEETDKLIAEVMAVLDETNDVIIGREITDDGERAITVPKNSFKEEIVDEEPRIAPELERVLQSINLKLDSLTVRLKDLEEEITHVKVNGVQIQNSVDKEQIEENIVELREELEIFEQTESELIEEDVSIEEDDEPLEIISEQHEQEVTDDIDELDSEELDQDQKVLESILSLETDSDIDEIIEDASDIDEENESKFEDELEEKAPELEEKEVTSTDVLDELINIPNDDLVDLPEDDILESVEEERLSTDSIIGTELSSAMISELKDLSDDDTTPQNEEFLTQPLQIDHEDEKKKCPICGEPTKYIRQHNRHYCVKCGRYLI